MLRGVGIRERRRIQAGQLLSTETLADVLVRGLFWSCCGRQGDVAEKYPPLQAVVDWHMHSKGGNSEYAETPA
jgi:hypothetical protein